MTYEQQSDIFDVVKPIIEKALHEATLVADHIKPADFITMAVVEAVASGRVPSR